MLILSYFQALPIIQAIKSQQSQVQTSLDLNLTKTILKIDKQNLLLPDRQRLDLKQLQKIARRKNQSFIIKNNQIKAVNFFSQNTGWVRTLFPTESAPTTLVSGILMHRIKNTNPWYDSMEKIKALGKISGKALDTATGLGYTAILASEKADQVVSVELDPAAIELAKLNPWSKKLFDNPKIKIIISDILDQVKKFDSNEFNIIIHDPPTFKLAGELYSLKLYQQFYRLLKPGGKLFHYIGDPESKHGSSVTWGVVKRLQEAGFKRIERQPKVFGLTAKTS